MKKTILILTTLLLFANFAHARLGETLEELEKRFGDGRLLPKVYIKPPFTAIYDFSKNGINIRVYFVGGNQCDMISYSATPGQHLKPDEMETLLMINRGSNKWVKLEKAIRFEANKANTKPKQSWKSSSGGHFAYNFNNSTITIFSKNYLAKYNEHQEKVAKEKQAKEKTKLDGF